MTVRVTDAEWDDYPDEPAYTSTPASFVVIEPSYLVNVTDVRSWVDCPRLQYLGRLTGVPLNYPVLKGTLVHEVFGDLLRGRALEAAIAARVEERGLELGLLGEDPDAVAADVRQHAGAIEGWLEQGRLPGGSGSETDRETGGGGVDGADGTTTAQATLGSAESASGESASESAGESPAGSEASPATAGAVPEPDDSSSSGGLLAPDEREWRSEQLLISETYGLKGRADAVRRGVPVELKTGKNTRREPRFQDKVQAACYGLLLEERGAAVDTGTLLYTKNAALDRTEATGDLSPAKDFSISRGFLQFVLSVRNEIAASAAAGRIPTGYESDPNCETCFERDTCMVVSGRLDQASKGGQLGEPLPGAEQAHFEELWAAIEDERRAVHDAYARLWQRSGEERAENDRALVDLEPAGIRELEDGQYELRAHRTGTSTTRLREGDYALASEGHPIRSRAEPARIVRLDADEVVLTAEEPVELCRLDAYPSELTTDRLVVALGDGILKADERRRDVLFGRAAPSFEDVAGTFVPSNPAQDRAVRAALGAEDCALIQGPPGTGKTFTIARTVAALLERDERVLLSAFTNRAVDNALAAVLEALPDADPERIVRMGSERAIREDLREYRLPRSGDPTRLADRFRGADVVAATTAACGSRAMREGSFDVAIVDEAAQLTEPGTYAAINRADRFVLVGDHQQLPPVVRSGGALSTSLFERLAEGHPDAVVLLDRQYRMNQRIQAFPSAEFYDGALRPADADVAGRGLADLEGVDPGTLPAELRDPVTFLDVPGDDGEHTDHVEAERIEEVVASLAGAGVDPAEVGVIAPFRSQVAVLRERLPEAVTVDTVDRFQGSSEEVVVVSFVATGTLEGPIFEDYRRVNVALTRARRALVLVGDARALREDPVYRRMLEWAT